MEEITKDDLRQLRLALYDDVKRILDSKLGTNQQFDIDWLRGKAIRQIMSISPATLQNLRVTGKIRFKKILGTYYYNKTDLIALFDESV